MGPVIKCFVIPSKKLWRNHLLYTGWITILPWFQEARPDHMRVESSCCCFPRKLVSFVCLRELLSFDPWHVTHSPPIGKRIWVGRYNKRACCYCHWHLDFKFCFQEEFAGMIEDAGFSHVTYENLTFGITAIHSGFKLWSGPLTTNSQKNYKLYPFDFEVLTRVVPEWGCTKCKNE